MQSRLGRPAGDAEHLGNLGKRQVEVEVEDEDDTLLRLQPGQRTIEQVAVGDLRRSRRATRRSRAG
jgi:hypothetical protein